LHEEEVELLVHLAVEDGLALHHGRHAVEPALRLRARSRSGGRRGARPGFGRRRSRASLALRRSRRDQGQGRDERPPLLHEFSLGAIGHGTAASARSSICGGCSRRRRARKSASAWRLLASWNCSCTRASCPVVSAPPITLLNRTRSCSCSTGVICEEGTM